MVMGSMDTGADSKNGNGRQMAGRQTAIALRYDPDVADAPRITATGQGALAEQILQLAFANGVKVRSDPDLAQILSTFKVDTVIPVEAFVAVAEILAYVYRANNQPLPVKSDEVAVSVTPDECVSQERQDQS